MEKIKVKDLRCAVSYILRNGADVDQFDELSDEEFLKLDFCKDLKMGNIRVLNVVIELERVYDFNLSLEVLSTIPDNTIGALFDTINRYLTQK